MTTATLDWTAPTTNSDGSAITDAITYNLYQGTSAASLAKVQSGLTATTATVTPLVPGSTDFFAVTAVVDGQESADSLEVSVTVPALVPNPPTGLTVTLS